MAFEFCRPGCASLSMDARMTVANMAIKAGGKAGLFVPDAVTLDYVEGKAKKQNLHNLGGHRSIGGMRASIYNAMPEEGIDKLIAFMKEFEKAHA